MPGRHGMSTIRARAAARLRNSSRVAVTMIASAHNGPEPTENRASSAHASPSQNPGVRASQWEVSQIARSA